MGSVSRRSRTSGLLQFRRTLSRRAAAALVTARVQDAPLERAWILAHRDLLGFAEPDAMWFVPNEHYWKLYDANVGAPWAEELAWHAAQRTPPGDECGADCFLGMIAYGPQQYWTRLPNGRSIHKVLTLALNSLTTRSPAIEEEAPTRKAIDGVRLVAGARWRAGETGVARSARAARPGRQTLKCASASDCWTAFHPRGVPSNARTPRFGPPVARARRVPMNSSVRRLAVAFCDPPVVCVVDSTSLVAQTAPSAPFASATCTACATSARPEISPDGQWVAYTAHDARLGEGQIEHRRLDGELGRHAADSADVVAGRRDVAAMEPGREVPVVPLVARRRQRVAALAARPPRRRSAARDRAERRHRRIRVGAGQQAHRAHHARVARYGRLGELETQADRHRPIPLQGRRQRLPRLDARAPLRVRRRRQESDADHAGHVRGIASGVVARRKIARLRQHASAGGRSRPDEQLRRLRRRSAGRRDAEASHHVRRARRRSALVESGRAVARVSAGQRAEILRVRRTATRRRERGRRSAAHSHRRARPADLVGAVQRRRQVDRVSLHGRSRAVRRTRGDERRRDAAAADRTARRQRPLARQGRPDRRARRGPRPNRARSSRSRTDRCASCRTTTTRGWPR